MTCKYCGNQLTNQATFCPKCGKRVSCEVQEEVCAADCGNPLPIDNDKQDGQAGRILLFAIMGLAFGVTGILSVLGIVFSYLAKARIGSYVAQYGQTNGRASVGKGISIGGMIVSWVGAAVFTTYVLTAVVQRLL
ncbi:MAG: zinc-ribbon domain-containing protein [Clostridia bacterium]|nr:zinc-ribbon domain-containing protein [Clostridia bacterium]